MRLSRSQLKNSYLLIFSNRLLVGLNGTSRSHDDSVYRWSYNIIRQDVLCQSIDLHMCISLMIEINYWAV